MDKKKSLVRLDHPDKRKKKNILKKAGRIITWKNAKKLILYSFFGFFSFALLLFAWFAKDLPSPNKINSRLLSESTKILDREGNLIYEVHGDKNRTVIPFNEMPQNIKNATIAIEDREFYKHRGFSIKGYGRALYYDLIHKDMSQGGSGITQQFVKNALLTREKKLSRKIKELILSIEIELIYSKDDILKMYLNEIPYGSNAYGIEAAAKTYFGKSAKDLSLPECATIAAMAKAPTYYSPFGSHKDKLLERKDLVLNEMVKQEYIEEKETKSAQNEKLTFTRKKESITYPHFVIYVKEKLVEKYGEKLVEKGGLKITTTIDPQKQKIAEEAIAKGTTKVKKYGGSNASLTSIDPKTGQILTMVGSFDYFDDSIDGNVNIAIRDRQPGSSFKPFAYATAWKKDKYGPGMPMFDLKTSFTIGIKDCKNKETYCPENYDEKEHGVQTMRASLAQSLNIPAVKTLYIAGVKDTINTAHDMGITTLNQDPSHYGLSLVLGSGEVKLLDMAGAYGVFANKGEKKDVTPILKVETSKGKVIEEYKDKKGKTAIDPQIAYLMSSVLSDNNARTPIFGSNSPLTLKNRPVAAKTGTTQEWKDAWTIGYTPSLVAGVWVGNNDGKSMSKGADGSFVAAGIWNDYMSKTLAGTTIEKFEKPPGIRTITIDKVTGKKPMQGSETVTDEFPSWYNMEKSQGKTYKINRLDGKLATEDCPNDVIKIIKTPQVQAEIPPGDKAYTQWMEPISRWARSHGYGTMVLPTEYTTLCGVGNQPSVSLSLSSNTIDLGDSVTATAIASAPLGVNKVLFYLDNDLVGTDSSSPYIVSITPSSAGSHRITAKVKDKGANYGQDSNSVYVSGSGSIPGVTLNLSIVGSTSIKAILSGEATASDVMLYFTKNNDSVVADSMTPTGSDGEYVWSGSTSEYKSVYAKASTNKGTITSNTIDLSG